MKRESSKKTKDLKSPLAGSLSDKKNVSTNSKKTQNSSKATSKQPTKSKKKKSNKLKRLENTRTIIKKASKNSPNVVEIKNIRKVFGTFEALKGVSFAVKKGERVGLIGGNGAGKTTVTEIIAGINKATSGQILYGFDYKESPKEGIGMQFQQSTYPSGLTVQDIIGFAINLRKLSTTKRELAELLEVFQMTAFYKRKVRSLSGGQRQKLNILLSILHNPQLVILDELSTGLDISAREEIIQFTDEFLAKRHMSAILISHHMAEISALCSKVIILDNGAVADIKSIKEIETKHGGLEKYTRKLIEVSNARTIAIAQGKSFDEKEKEKEAAKKAKQEKKLEVQKQKIQAKEEKKKQRKIASYNAKEKRRKEKEEKYLTPFLATEVSVVKIQEKKNGKVTIADKREVKQLKYEAKYHPDKQIRKNSKAKLKQLRIAKKELNKERKNNSNEGGE